MRRAFLLFVLFVLIVAALVSFTDRAHATTWPEYLADHHAALTRGNPGPPYLGAITPAWLSAHAEYLTARRRRVDRLFHRWQDVRAAELAVAPSVGWGGGPWSADWDAIADCEWDAASWTHAITTGNGYFFRLQFSPGTWNAYRGDLTAIVIVGDPGGSDDYWPLDLAPTREEQIGVAERVLAAQGPGAWPNCFVGT